MGLFVAFHTLGSASGKRRGREEEGGMGVS